MAFRQLGEAEESGSERVGSGSRGECGEGVIWVAPSQLVAVVAGFQVVPDWPVPAQSRRRLGLTFWHVRGPE